MRNLKRALSLALASVMLLGMMVVGTGASYADVTSKHNQEAIEVMQAVGVMSGDDKGNFNPDQKVTRGEMAVVMANLLKLNVKDFIGAKTPFTDVPEWAVPYVAACYADGITAGISATEYGFNYEVTTAQAALMMMKALGYFQLSKDFGSDWQVATVKQGSKIDLFDGITAGASTAMTRNEVAQIALNTLKATKVETDGTNTTVTLPGGIVIDSGDTKYVEVTGSGSKYQAIKDDQTGTSTGKYYVQLGEDLFGGDLKLNASVSSDDFGAPANVWTYKDYTGKYAKDAILTYTDSVKANELADDIKDAGYKVTSDGSDTALTVYSNGNPQKFTGTQVGNAITGKTEFGGKGIELKVYDANDDDVADTIVMVYTYAAKITNVTKDDADTSKDERELKVEAYMGSNKTATITLDEDTVGFDAIFSKVEKDDIVLVTPKNDTSSADAAWTVSLPTSVTGAVTAVKSDSITVGGTAYDIAACERAVSTSNLNADKDVVLYLDAYGNAIYTTAVAATNKADLIYVTAVYTGNGDWGDVKMIQGVLADGTVVTAEYKTSGDGLVINPAENTVYEYEMDGNVYALKAATATGSAIGAFPLDSYTIDDSDVRLKGTLKNYFASDVTFVYIDGNKSDIKVTVKSGVQDLTGTAKDFAAVSKDADGNYVISTVFVNGTASTASSDLIYVADAWDEASTDVKYGNDGKTKLYGYEAYLNGTKTTIYVEGSSVPNKAVGFYSYTVDDKTGAYTLKDEKSGVAVGDTIDVIGNVNGKYYIDLTTNSEVVDFDATDAKVIDTRTDGKVDTMSELKDNASSVKVSVIYDKDKETVSYIYVAAK